MMGRGETVGRTPWSAADALVGLLAASLRRSLLSASPQRVQGDPRGPGGPPYNSAPR